MKKKNKNLIGAKEAQKLRFNKKYLRHIRQSSILLCT